jgi:hypothetical protein
MLKIDKKNFSHNNMNIDAKFDQSYVNFSKKLQLELVSKFGILKFKYVFLIIRINYFYTFRIISLFKIRIIPNERK